MCDCVRILLLFHCACPQEDAKEAGKKQEDQDDDKPFVLKGIYAFARWCVLLCAVVPVLSNLCSFKRFLCVRACVLCVRSVCSVCSCVFVCALALECVLLQSPEFVVPCVVFLSSGIQLSRA